MTDGISFNEAVKVWQRIAALSFGGPAGQIAVMHRKLGVMFCAAPRFGHGPRLQVSSRRRDLPMRPILLVSVGLPISCPPIPPFWP